MTEQHPGYPQDPAYGQYPEPPQYPDSYSAPQYGQPQYGQLQYGQRQYGQQLDPSPYPSRDDEWGSSGPEPGLAQWRDAPTALHPVLGLLALNLLLSVALTVATLVLQRSIVDYQLDHRHIVEPHLREIVRNAYSIGIFERVFGNVVVSIVYIFLARALIRGRRWAYRRVLVVGIFGAVALVLIQLTPYPAWMHVEQSVQAVVLAAMVYFATRPAVRAHFDPKLPGRTTRRFNR